MATNFKCWVEGYNDAETAEVVNAYCDDTAAEEYAERYHDGCADYPTDTKVHVIHLDGKTSIFNVTWEAQRVYYSEEIQEAK